MQYPTGTFCRIILPLVIVFGSASSPSAAVFLKIDDIKGESQDKAHRDEIDVLSWSWGMERPVTGGDTGSTRQRGSVVFEDLKCTKYLDKATPKLMEACSKGTHMAEATLVVRKPGTDNPLEYLVITMRDVLVTSVSTGGSGGEDRLTENVTLSFTEVEVRYTAQNQDGGTGEVVEMTWNLETGTP